jgi:hypothetical protein
VDDVRERLDGLTLQEQDELDEVGGLVTRMAVGEGGVARGVGLELGVKGGDEGREGHEVGELGHGARLAGDDDGRDGREGVAGLLASAALCEAASTLYLSVLRTKGAHEAEGHDLGDVGLGNGDDDFDNGLLNGPDVPRERARKVGEVGPFLRRPNLLDRSVRSKRCAQV